MNNKTNSFSSAPIYYGYQNNNNLIQYYPNTNCTNLVTKKNNKKVTFNTDVVVYNVESYKAHNKKFCYNEDEEFENITKSGYNDYYYKKYSRQFNNLKDSKKKKEENNCCCIIL